MAATVDEDDGATRSSPRQEVPMSDDLVDTAVTAVKAATRAALTCEPVELCTQLAALTELCWNLEHYTVRVARAYNTIGPLHHDHGTISADETAVIRARLAHVARLFGDIDTALQEAHNHAAHLARCSTARHRDHEDGPR
jgi:DNA-binding transcriptional regulator PaaX